MFFFYNNCIKFFALWNWAPKGGKKNYWVSTKGNEKIKTK